jgi:secondary thiamine-phosphate synthase enzyme
MRRERIWTAAGWPVGQSPGTDFAKWPVVRARQPANKLQYPPMIHHITIDTSGQGLYEFTEQVTETVSQANAAEGICILFVQHTSASLIIQENADPSAKGDLERWLNRLVQEGDPMYRHTLEGPDDMPAHIKSVLTATSLSIPIDQGQLQLGTWQGVYLWEHRHQKQRRRVIVYIGK